MKFDSANSIDKNKAILTFNKFIENQWKFELKRIHEKRSVSQNSYMHVVLAYAGMFRGFTLEEMKIEYKREFGLYYTKNNKKFVRSTADLNKDEISSFIDYIRTKEGIDGNYIPTSQEYLENKFNIDREIESYKNYL
jgi:hypothetical protein